MASLVAEATDLESAGALQDMKAPGAHDSVAGVATLQQSHQKEREVNVTITQLSWPSPPSNHPSAHQSED